MRIFDLLLQGFSLAGRCTNRGQLGHFLETSNVSIVALDEVECSDVDGASGLDKQPKSFESNQRKS